VQLVRRYGVYAGKVRKQWQERPGIYRLAPESRQKGHPNKALSVVVKPQESEDAVQAPDAWSKLRKQSWASQQKKGEPVTVCARASPELALTSV
jgi:hypothetical protein